MTLYELTNNQRQYFGLNIISPLWERQNLSDNIIVYFEKDKIVKVLNFIYGYLESDVKIETIDKKILLPKTRKGKQQKLTVSKLLKIKGSGVQFSASFSGGGITVFDNSRNVFFIKSYLEEGEITNYNNIENWVEKYISESPSNYFEWLEKEMKIERRKIKTKQWDIIAFPVGRNEYAFASTLLDGYTTKHTLLNGAIFNFNLFGKPVLILPYSFVSKTLDINFDDLIKQPTLSPTEIMATCVSNGEFKVVSNKQLENINFSEINLSDLPKFLTIPYTKTDILKRNKLK